MDFLKVVISSGIYNKLVSNYENKISPIISDIRPIIFSNHVNITLNSDKGIIIIDINFIDYIIARTTHTNA